jgi:predicted nucleic acid-binding protein
MRGKFFLDTNLFVYSFDGRAPVKQKRASELIRSGLEEHRGVISFQVVQEFFSVAFRKFPAPMKIPGAEHYLVSVLRPLLGVHSSKALYSESLGIKGRYGINWYDSIIVASAIQARCEVLYSEDLQHELQIGELTIRNPFV